MTVACRYCGKAIVWGKTPDGRAVPLNPSAPVYRIVGYSAGPGPTPEIHVELCAKDPEGRREAMLLHHHDCREFHERERRSREEVGV